MTNNPALPASSTFESFLQLGVDRCAFISSWLRAREIPHTIVHLAGKKHIVVRFDSSSYDPHFRMKTLVAHYDRANDTPGANDNSAACFQLMLFAEQLASQSNAQTPSFSSHNIRIFFTDGEEAAGTKGIAGQGAFALGSGLRKLKMTEDDVYVFDACGRGDTLILSTAGVASTNKTVRPEKFSTGIERLHERAAEIALSVSSENWMRLPTPYSDNAGFIASGIASQVFTILPHEEASALLGALHEQKSGEVKILDAIIANRALSQDSPLISVIPKTWRLMHTKDDTASTLSTSAFTLMEKLLLAIAKRMEIA